MDATQATTQTMKTHPREPMSGISPTADDVRFMNRPHVSRDATIRARIVMERAIARRFIRDTLDASPTYAISVCDGETWPLIRSRDEAVLLDALMSTDVDVLAVSDGENRIGSLVLVYGNSGYDVMSDYSDSKQLAPLLAGAIELADRLEGGAL